MIAEVLAFLKKYGYADDREYCRRYIREKLRLKPKSGYALGLELRQRGVSSYRQRKCLRETEIDLYEWMPCGGWRKKVVDNGRLKTKKEKTAA